MCGGSFVRYNITVNYIFDGEVEKMRLFATEREKFYRLEGLWAFRIDPEKSGEKEKWEQAFPDDADKLYVPSCWNVENDYYGYFGDAWYETQFTAEAENVMLRFCGVLNSCTVFIDGKKAGEYYGAFGEYDLPLTGIGAGKHKLTVKVNNETDEITTIPRACVDWYHHGGLFRSVEVHSFDTALISRLHVPYKLAADGSAELTAKADLIIDESKYGAKVSVGLLVDGETVFDGEAELKDKMKIPFTMKNVKLWDTDSPNLYTVTLRVGNAVVSERIGFRTFTAEKGKFYLNGRRMILRGFNRHEEHPAFGFALPFPVSKRDIDIIRSAHSNFVRFSHYPVAKETLDYCDEKGILVWEEIPLWGASEESVSNETLISRALFMHENMVTRDFNHPSICVWGLHNEIATYSEAGRALTEKMFKLNKSLDGSRLITFATMHGETDICFRYCDFVSLNKYIGWYGEGGIHLWDKFFDDVFDNMKKQGCEDKPVIVSEYGCEGLVGETSFYDAKWLESSQCKNVSETVEYLFSRKDIQGFLYWQFCDMRSSGELGLQRARGMNNKGSITEYRNPKAVFFALKSIYEKVERREKELTE